jgi:heme ABC exporter ATP-binding subunit CcmA
MSHRVGIEAVGVTKTLGTRTVLRGVDLAIAAGESVVLRGDNGSGKTTLLRCLAGLYRLDAGQIRWFERSPAEIAAHHLIGMVAHESHLHPHLSLRENLILAGRLQDVSGPIHRARLWLEAAGLAGHADRLPREVSEGMRRRASLARALLHEPPILLLDEPFSGLDQAGVTWFYDVLLERQRRGLTTCLVTHDVYAIRPLADRIVELRSGRLWDSAGPSASKATDDMLAVSVSIPGCHAEVTA